MTYIICMWIFFQFSNLKHGNNITYTQDTALDLMTLRTPSNTRTSTTSDPTRPELLPSRVTTSSRNSDTTVRNPTSGPRLETALSTKDSRRPSRLDSRSGGTSDELSSGALPEPWNTPPCLLSSLRMSSLPWD